MQDEESEEWVRIMGQVQIALWKLKEGFVSRAKTDRMQRYQLFLGGRGVS